MGFDRAMAKPQVALIPGAISEILASAAETGQIAVVDRYGLMAAVMDESLCEDDRRCVDRLLRSIQRGRIRVVDDLCPKMQA